MSSSLTYTLTKLRSLPSSLYRWRFSSPYWDVSAPRSSPTVPPVSSTESFLSAYWRSGVGMRILGIVIRIGQDQLFGIGNGLLLVGNERFRVVDPAGLNGDNHVRVPGPGVREVGRREVGVAIRVRVEEAEHVEPEFAGAAVGGDLFFRVELKPVRLLAFV